MPSRDAFQPAWWLPGAHAQTLWATVFRTRLLVTLRREVLATPDGDELALDHVDGPPGAPRLLLLHGLEGSAHAPSVQGMAARAARLGWRVTVLNFRSCARDPADPRRLLANRRPRIYHSGETGDLDLVVRTLIARDANAPLCAFGISLGGNVLLKWLGERGQSAPLRAAAVIGVPYELAVSARFLERAAGRPYTRHFLTRLRRKTLAKLAAFPEETRHLDRARILAARTFPAFDDSVTAPLHGFASAADYYQRSSSLDFLASITVPTLCISSRDDPFNPAASLDRAMAIASARVAFQVTRRGGHVGYVAGRWPFRPVYWAEDRAIAWLAGHLDASRPAPVPSPLACKQAAL